MFSIIGEIITLDKKTKWLLMKIIRYNCRTEFTNFKTRQNIDLGEYYVVNSNKLHIKVLMVRTHWRMAANNWQTNPYEGRNQVKEEWKPQNGRHICSEIRKREN